MFCWYIYIMFQTTSFYVDELDLSVARPAADGPWRQRLRGRRVGQPNMAGADGMVKSALFWCEISWEEKNNHMWLYMVNIWLIYGKYIFNIYGYIIHG